MSRIVGHFAGALGAFLLDAAFDIPAHDVTGLFGPSGCGKSTLLRCLAGLMRFPGGELRVDGEVWQREGLFLPPYKRALGYVFQDARLFAHLTVRENLRFGQRRAGAGPVAEDDVIDFLGLEPLLGRHPAVLSGGERQRVAMGRALLAQPRLLLMDEPLAALDRASTEEILPHLRGVSSRFGVPALYVSHQMDEVERIAQHLLLMKEGRIVAAGGLVDMLTDLTLPFAGRTGAATVLDLKVSGRDERYGLTICGAAPLTLIVPGCLGTVGESVRLRVRASDVSLLRTAAQSSILNLLPARLLAANVTDSTHVLVALGVGDARLLAHITRKSWEGLGLAPGQEVFAQIKAEALASAQ